MKRKPELLAPAGDWAMLNTALMNGADAIYFGVENYNMRAKAKNFSINDFPEIVNLCRSFKAKAFLTVNSIIFEDELEGVENLIKEAKTSGIDMIICWDMAVINLCNKYEMPFGISTQASVSNSTAAEYYKKLGAKRIVLARECNLEQIKKIRQNTDVEIEAFIHGAMCVAISGRCFMSHHIFDKSANRGECIQPCRREYEIRDVEDGDHTLILGRDYIMSPKDLSTINFLDQIIEAGLDSVKIEGRKRSPEYIAKAVSSYRKAIDLYHEGKLTSEIKNNFEEELLKVYNRGFSSGFYLDTPDGDDFTDARGSKATHRKTYVGKVINYFKKSNIVHAKIESSEINIGEDILIIGSTSGVVETKINELMKDEVIVNTAKQGDEITFHCENTVRIKDLIYKFSKI